MMRHETERLWALAADELSLEDRRYVELHLSDCPECQDSLDAVSVARRALDTARRSGPVIDWVETDAKVGALVERRLGRVTRPRWFPFAVGLSLAGAAAGLAVTFWPVAPLPSPPPSPPLVEVVETPRPIRVDLARGLTRVAASNEPVAAGDVLGDGDVLRTGVAGKAFVHLPDSSHLRIAASTQVVLNKAHADEVELTVGKGRLAVLASHEARRSFVVHAQDVSVHVVGTIFSVANGAEGVEVAVAEGSVRVESGALGETLVKAGQRLVIDERGKARVGALPRAVERELSEVQGLAEAVAGGEAVTGVVAAQGGRAERAQSLPRLSTAEAKARQVEPLSPVAPSPTPGPDVAPVVPEGTTVVVEPKTEVEVVRHDGPGTAFPSLAGGFTRQVPTATADVQLPSAPQGPVTEEAEWVALPKPAPAPAAIAPTLIVPSLEPVEHRPEPKPSPVRAGGQSLEQVFLDKAQAAIAQGGCERFLPGLEDLVHDGSSSAELARVLRARCFEAQLRPRQAMSEYTKYLEAHPQGRYAAEARAALGH